MLEEDVYLGKIADVELKDESWERLHNLFENSRYHLLVDRQNGAGSNKGYIVMELDSKPTEGFEVLAIASNGALWDHMIEPSDSGDFYLPKVANKHLLSKGEKLLICEKIS